MGWKFQLCHNIEITMHHLLNSKCGVANFCQSFLSHAWLTVILWCNAENGITDICIYSMLCETNASYVMFDVHISSSLYVVIAAESTPMATLHCTVISIPFPFSIHAARQTMKKLEHICKSAHTNTGKTVKTNKLVIGIMVIQLISFRMYARLIDGMGMVKTFVRLYAKLRKIQKATVYLRGLISIEWKNSRKSFTCFDKHTDTRRERKRVTE